MASSFSRIAFIAILACGVAACSGTKGDAGNVGLAGAPGPAGPGGGSSGVPNVTTATNIKAVINSVTVGADSKATVKFSLRNEIDLPLKGLPAANVRFTIAQLRAGVGGAGSEWRAYVTRLDGAQIQANAETASTAGAVFKDNGDGTYEYTFSKLLNAYGPNGASYDGNLTHRVGLELRSDATTLLAASNNAPYTFVPATGSTTVFPTRREIVENATCDACHDRLEFHGGPRTDVQYCVTCHNPGTTDGQAPFNSLAMVTMVHKIHMGAKLTNGYKITGFGGAVNDFSAIKFPQDQRNCQTCHKESDANTPDASNWRTTPYSRACGACHDNVNFATGLNHGPASNPGGAATDDQCVTCHGPNSTVQNGQLKVDYVHRIPTLEASKKFKYNIISVTNTAPGQQPIVKFSVTDPTNNNAPYNILTNPAFTVAAGGASRLAVSIGWNTANYTNKGSNSATALTGTPAQPISINPLSISGGTPAVGPDANGVFTSTSPLAIPADVTGSIGVAIDGHPAVDADGDGIPDRIAVTNVIKYAVATGTLTPRRDIINTRKCDDCHKQLTLHGNNRTDEAQVCAMCHNPNATDVSRRAAASGACAVGTKQSPIDLKYMIHAIHNGEESGYGACGFGNNFASFADLGYPGKLNNCEGCHVTPAANATGSYYPVDPAKVLATTVDVGANRSTTTDDVAWSPNVAICSGCHLTSTAEAHMLQNGGSKTLTKNADGTTAGGPLETCALCHGPGRVADVKEVHKIGSFQFQAPSNP